MKNKIYFIPLFIISFVLAACSGTQAVQTTPTSDLASQVNNSGGNQPGQTGQNRGAGASLEFRLAAGTFKLEGTDQAVTPAEAKQLLPLWENIKKLSADTNSQAAAVQTAYQAVESAMTSDQVTTINNMSLTQADLQGLMQELGIQMPQGQANDQNGTPFPTLSPDELATRTAQRQSQTQNGTPPAGGRGANGGGFPGGRGFAQVFLDPLINLLQTRAGS